MLNQFLKFIITSALIISVSVSIAAEHKHHTEKPAVNHTCTGNDIKCAKTVTSAFAPNGDLWRLWVSNESMYFQISTDEGVTFSKAKQVAIAKEKIAARNENRPKIGFDNFQGVYLSWAMPRERKYTADIRFSYSKDYGKTFTTPITVNDDNLLAGHSFNEMLVSGEGDISLSWLDGRLAHKQRQQGKKINGSALYLAKANMRNNETQFSNDSLAVNTCVCCRIAMTVNQQDELAIFWRHIYGDNMREFALLTLSENSPTPEPIQISHDQWQINGCPHQGGAISIDTDNTYHMVWFNLGDKGKGIFYAYSHDQGQSQSTSLKIGNTQAQASHPHIMQYDNTVDIVWTEFTGIEHQLWHQQSKDNGKSFADAKPLAQARLGSDRPFIIKKRGLNFVSWHRPKQGHLLQAL